MKLSDCISGKQPMPMRILLHGVEKVGKSTFASQWPKPVFLVSESGTEQLDIMRFPLLQTAQDVFGALDSLLTETHDRQTVVIDSVDWVSPLLASAVLRAAGKKTLTDIPWGEGYNQVVDMWRGVLARLDVLRNTKGMHSVLIAHSTIRTFVNPEGDNYDRYELKLQKKEAALLKEWVDAVLFANYDTATVVKQGKAKGVDSGARLLYTVRHAAYDAGNRFDLPESMVLDFDTFWAAKDGDKGLADKILSIAKEVEPQVKACNGDVKKLMQLLNRVKAK